MSNFYTDIQQGTVSYKQLISDLNNQKCYYKYCYADSFYSIFRDIIVSMIAQKEMILLDKHIFDSLKIDNELIICDFPNISEIEELNEHLLNAKNWMVTLFTSGTTGIPKKITHRFNNITRNIKIKSDFRTDIWGYAYNPTHMAGLQVFLQSVMNTNHMVRLFNYSNELQLDLIENHKVNKLSGTPTFYKMLYKDNKHFDFVKSVTLGGEKASPKVINMLKTMFPKAKINNIYASTEIGTLLLSDSDVFTVKEELSDKIKIINNQLYVSAEYLGVIDGKSNQIEFYPTGDIVEVLNNKPLTFIFRGRDNEIINIAGNKVYTQDVENIILSFEGIKFCKVYSKPNSITGNIIITDIVLEPHANISEKELRIKLSKILPSYMVPRLFNFIDDIEITRTGKIKR